MEVIQENTNKDKNNQNSKEQNIESIPKLDLDEPSFKLITKEQEKKEDQSFNISEKSDNNPKSKNDKSTEENSLSILSNKNSKGIIPIENNERKSSINLNIEVIKEEKYNDKKTKKKKRINMDNPSPEVYLGENIVRTEFNINPMEVKLKRLEKEIESQYNYDYNKAMKEIKDKLENIKRREEQMKHIQEEDKKMKEKLKSMEEYRENKMKELIKRVERKQKINRNKNKRNKSNNEYSNKSSLSSRNYIKTTVDNDNIKEKKKLPPIISSYDKYKKMLEKKKTNEEDFILNTEEDIKSLELEHQENYNYMNSLLNQKLQEKKKLYEERNELYSKYRIQKELEKKEQFLEKDIKHRYNVQCTILKSSEEKNGKLQEKIKKNLENFNEKRILLKEKEKKKVKEYLKKINKYKIGNSISNYEDKRKSFLDLQKFNISKSKKDLEQKYSDILDKQEYLLSVAYDIEKKDLTSKKNMIKNSRKMEDENEKIYKNFNQFLGKIEKNNINSKNDNIKLKLYNKKVKEELEEKNRKEEEELKKLGL